VEFSTRALYLILITTSDTLPYNGAMSEEEEYERPSKSARKRASDDLQALGEALIDLPQSELDALPLPEQLLDAVLLARRIKAHGGLYRQKQYIGKLMRKIDAEPIRAAMNAKRERERVEALRFRRIEQWRDRLVKDGVAALEQLRAETSQPLDDKVFSELISRAREERTHNSPPHASRELFRLVRDALAG
jgi:ribosome-associated protein